MQKLCGIFIITKLPQLVLSVIFSSVFVLYEKIFYPIDIVLQNKVARGIFNSFRERRSPKSSTEKLTTNNNLTTENTTLINSVVYSLNNSNNPQQDYDVISLSGDGSQLDFESDQDEHSQQCHFNYSNVINNQCSGCDKFHKIFMLIVLVYKN